jgi:hypothetical protein
MRLPPGCLMLLLSLAASGPALAEEVYKSTMPDGSVVYGESPQPGARKVEKIDARAAVSGAVIATPHDKQRADQIGSNSSPSVGVLPQAQRDPAPALQSGTMSQPGTMPKRGY